MNQIEIKRWMPVSNVILIQWQKCEIFLIKPLLSVIFHDKSKHIETTQETNTELSFSLTLRKISKYLFLFCPHKSKIFILHSFSAEWFKIQFSSTWQVIQSYTKTPKCTEDKWRQTFKELHCCKDLPELWLWEFTESLQPPSYQGNNSVAND